MVDMDGRALVLDSQPADPGPRRCDLGLASLAKVVPVVEKAFADISYSGNRPQSATLIDIQIVGKAKDQVGFAVHPRRWVVERFSAWISRQQRLWKDPEATIESTEAFLYAASVTTLIRRIASQSSILGRSLSDVELPCHPKVTGRPLSNTRRRGAT